MKKYINSKCYNTETSRKVCSYEVNYWVHELYQRKSGEYFTFIYFDGDEHHLLDELRLVSQNEVSHMLERSGLESKNNQETILFEKDEDKNRFYDDENLFLKISGKGGFVHFDYGSWEFTIDIDDKNWANMVIKGKSIFNEDDLNIIDCIRWRWDMIRDEYLKERYGRCL